MARGTRGRSVRVGTGGERQPVRERLAQLERLLAAQGERLAEQDWRLMAQQEEIARLRAERALPAMPPPLARGRDAADEGADGGGAPGIGRAGRASRRSLLKLGGAVAVAGVAAGTLGQADGGRAQARALHSLSGSPVTWTTGTVTVPTETLVQQGPFYNPGVNDILQVQAGYQGSVYQPVPSGLMAAVAAYDTTNTPGNNVGVYATSNYGYGLIGKTNAGLAAVAGYNTSGEYGIQGVSDASGGAGVAGSGGAGGYGGNFYGGAAQILLPPGATPGAPISGTHKTGEIYVDSVGTAWFCQAGSNAGGAWVAMTPQPGYLGGAINLLPVPIRLLDTRAGSPAGSAHLLTGTPVAYHATQNVPVSGFTFAGQTIPAAATAVFGTLTVALVPGVNPGDGSSAICWAAGSPRPVAVNIVFNPQDLHGAYTSTFTLVGIGAGGAISIYSQPITPGVAVDYLFDAFGFVM